MQKQPRLENPTLNEVYIQSYDGGDANYPVLAIRYEPESARYSVPAAYAHFTNAEDLAKYPNHVFVGATPLGDSNQRVEHIYMILPGPWLYANKLNEESGDLWPTKHRHNIGSKIVEKADLATTGSIPVARLSNHIYSIGDIVQPATPNGKQYECMVAGISAATPPTFGTTIAGTTTDGTVIWVCQALQNILLVATERQDITVYLAWETVTYIPKSAYFDKYHALESTESLSYVYPGRMHVISGSDGGTIYYQGVWNKQSRAETVNALVLTWWEVAVEKPSVAVDEIITDNILLGSGAASGGNAQEFGGVLHDGFTGGNYAGATAGIGMDKQIVPIFAYSGLLAAYPATTPTMSDYESTWIGHMKNHKFRATPVRWGLLWKCELVQLLMK